jgi:DNA repair exonuclease SbcCD nuclease subunit
MNLKLLHLADLHAKPERADELLQSIAAAKKESTGVDLIVVSGDVWDGVIRNTRGSRFPELLEAIRSLADVAPVAMIYGTPTHDAEGSLDVFPTLDSKFGITILEPGKAYFYHKDRSDPARISIDGGEYADAILFGVPEPSKKFLSEYFDNAKETDQAVRDGLRGLFGALGATRRQYPGLPCVMLYHGQVGGARLQNGDVLDNGSGIRPSIDDLAAVGADYIAMGDIHEPQQVGSLPAYYPGSAYPKDFGETHEAGGNLVEIFPGYDENPEGVLFGDGTFDCNIDRVPFGHPVNQTIKVTLDPFHSKPPVVLPGIMFEPGRRIKLEIRYSKEDGSIDTDAWLSKLLSEGAATGSIVKPDPILTETVRAEKITTAQTLVDKAAVWMVSSGKLYSNSIRAKIRQIETETTQANDQGPERRFRNVSTLIRGSKGFWKNQKKDEVFLDWESYGPGVVAYIGPNGYGKTTSFDFSKPWPVPVSRPPKTIKNHFRLRDSLIENIYLDEVSGVRYKSKITIDAGIASGKTEYYLSRDIGDGKGFQTLPGIEGRLDGYEQAVESIFGSMDIYLRTAYATQKPTKDRPDISEATQGEKKTLIAELAGKDGFAVYQAAAKIIGDTAEKSLIPKITEISTLESRSPDEVKLLNDIEIANSDREAARQNMVVILEKVKEASNKVETLGIRAAANRQTAEQITRADNLVFVSNGKISAIATQIQLDQDTLGRKEGAERTVQEFDALTKAVADQDTVYQKHLEAMQEHQKTVDYARRIFDDSQRADRLIFDQMRQEHQGKVGDLRTREYEAQRYLDNDRAELRSCQAEAKRLEDILSAPIADHCPTCRQMLPAEAMAHVQSERKNTQQELDEVKKDIATAEKCIIEAVKNLKAITAMVKHTEYNAPKSPEFPEFIPPVSTVTAWNDANRQTLKTQLSFCNIGMAREIIQKAAQSQVRIDELAKQLADLQATVTRERKQTDELRLQLNPSIDSDFAQAQAEYQTLQNQYREAQGMESKAQAMLDQATLRMKGAERERIEIAGLKAALFGLQADIAEWRYVENVIEGIRDLELDALAPHIASVATKILASSGRPGVIRIDTTRLSSEGGKRARQIEDFKIMYVGDDGEEQDIATCSGGEMVWQRKALYDAFAVIRSRNSRIRFTTGLLDETDGALFPEDRVNYFRMLEAGHIESGRFQTILITQAPEIAEMAQTVIDVRELKGRES